MSRPTAQDLRVAETLAEEILKYPSARTAWRRVSTLRALFGMGGVRFTSQERSRMQAALTKAGLTPDPPITEVDRGGTVRFSRRAAPAAVSSPSAPAPLEVQAKTTSEPAPSVFISYRRQDCQGEANGLNDGLRYRLPNARLFMDVDSILAGVDFEAKMREGVAASDVVLVLVGDNWLDADPEGTRRLDDENDYVRTEVRLALEGDVAVLPVLVEGARMPRASDLPGDIAPLARINAMTLDGSRWRTDLDHLAKTVERLARDRRKAPAPSPVSATPKAGPTKTVTLPSRTSQGWIRKNVPAMDAETLEQFNKLLREQRGWTAGEIIDLVHPCARRSALPPRIPVGDASNGKIEPQKRITVAWLERTARTINGDDAEALADLLRRRGWSEGDIEDHLYVYFRD